MGFLGWEPKIGREQHCCCCGSSVIRLGLDASGKIKKIATITTKTTVPLYYIILMTFKLVG